MSDGVPEGLILEPFLLLVYMKDLSDGLQSNRKHFAANTYSFSIIQDINTCTYDITKISEGAVQWKINFCKEAQELLFSRKISSKPYLPLNFNDNPFPKFNSKRT